MLFHRVLFIFCRYLNLNKTHDAKKNFAGVRVLHNRADGGYEGRGPNSRSPAVTKINKLQLRLNKFKFYCYVIILITFSY